MRFQKRIKILPGVNINLSKSGISTSLGPQGAKVTVGNGKIRKTIGLPGTGLSHTEVISTSPASKKASTAAPWGFLKLLGTGVGILFLLIIVFGVTQK